MNPEMLLLVVLAARLTPLQADSFIDVVVLERKQTDVAIEYGVSRSAVWQAVGRARRKMACCLADAA